MKEYQINIEEFQMKIDVFQRKISDTSQSQYELNPAHNPNHAGTRAQQKPRILHFKRQNPLPSHRPHLPSPRQSVHKLSTLKIFPTGFLLLFPQFPTLNYAINLDRSLSYPGPFPTCFLRTGSCTLRMTSRAGTL